MNAPLRPTVTTLGPGATRPALKRALWLPALTLVITAVVVFLTEKFGWLSVGGAVISALGARLWANRVFRVGARRGDEELPAPFFPPQPGAVGVQLNIEHLNARHQQALDNFYSYVGVWLSIGGGIIGSTGPFLLGLLWHPSG